VKPRDRPGLGPRSHPARGPPSLRLKGAVPTPSVLLPRGALRSSSPTRLRLPPGANETRVGRELPALVASGLTCDGSEGLPSGQSRLDMRSRLLRVCSAAWKPQRPPPRAAAPLSPKALSHEEAPCPPRPPPLHEAPRPRTCDPRPARDARGGEGRWRGCARTVSCGGPAPAGGSYRRECHGAGVALRDWRAGRRGEGHARTWALFLQQAAPSAAPRFLIKLRGAQPPAGRMRSTCAGPRPGPRPLRRSGRPDPRSAAHRSGFCGQRGSDPSPSTPLTK
jgi:hypothetical protein